ncbi:MAG: DUF6056 family protein [Oscillospiraceae bacterium]|nr:DUF6056 family protein [Oscillospiraceae bacterium]
MTARLLDRRVICLAMAAALFLSLLPLLTIARYNNLAIDDYNFGQFTAPVYRETGSAVETVKAAFHTVKFFFKAWQGTFTAVFIMSLHPAVFNESLYGLTTFLLLGSFIACMLYFLKVLLIGRFGADRIQYGVVSIVILTLCIHFLPSPVEAFYWWNGGMFYTGYYALALLLLALLLKPPKERPKAAVIVGGAGLVCLSFLIGGGNFVTTLLIIIASATLAGFRLVQDRKNPRWVIPAVCLIAACAALYIATLSPGAAYRQSLYTENMGAVQAVLESFRYAFLFMGRHLITNVPVLAGLAVLVPILYRIASGSQLPFRYPGIVTAFLFGVYASTFTPTLYAMGSFPYPRIHNVSFYSLLLFVLVSVLYWCGWLARKKETLAHPFTPIITGVLALLFIASSLAVAVTEKHRISGVSALRSLAGGQAKAYHQEAVNRRAVLLDQTASDVVIPRFTVKPPLLFMGHLGADEEQIGAAKFYGKNSIRLEP